MSDLAKTLDALKNGELTVVARKLIAMQTEITDALATIADLVAEVEGSLNSPVGTIHAPARLDSFGLTKEILSGEYQLGDLIPGVNGKTGNLRIGLGSFVYLHYAPSDPLHAVNRKYVDQVMNPITTQLSDTISRNGDMVPTKTLDTLGGATYIFTNNTASSTVEVVKWLLDDAVRGSQLDNFQAISDAISRFWLNVSDFKYFGNIASDPNHVLTLAAGQEYFLQFGANVGRILTFDDTSVLTWNDGYSKTVAPLTSSKPVHQLATIQNVLDLIPEAGGINYIFAFLTASNLPNTTTSYPLISFSKQSLTPYDSAIQVSGTNISVTTAGLYEITVVMRYNGATSNTTAGLKLLKNGTPVPNGDEEDTGAQEYINVINTIVQLETTDILTVGYICNATNNSCTVTMKLLNP